MCKEAIVCQFYIHRLVGESFIPNSNDYTDINHKDGNTFNNKVENLEWCNRNYNIKHSYNVLKRTKNLTALNQYREKRKRKINQYDLNGNLIKTWECINIAEKHFKGKNTGKICQCCQHKYGRKSAFGYKWEYAK